MNTIDLKQKIITEEQKPNLGRNSTIILTKKFKFLLIGFFIVISFLFDSHSASATVINNGVMFYGGTFATGTLRARFITNPATAATAFSATTSSKYPITSVRAKTAPAREEMMIGFYNKGGRLAFTSCTTGCDATGDFTSQWVATTTTAQDCDTAITPGACSRSFDIGYESTSSRAFVTYTSTSTSNTGFYYALWNGSAWSPNATPGTPGVSNEVALPTTYVNPIWTRVIPQGDNLDFERTNRIMVLVATYSQARATTSLFAYYWDGGAFDAGTKITDNVIASTSEGFDGAWASSSAFILAYGKDNSATVQYRKFVVGTGWGAETQAISTTGVPRWIRLAKDPLTPRILMASTQQTVAASAKWMTDGITESWTVCAITNCPDTSIESTPGLVATTAFERGTSTLSAQGLWTYKNAGTTDDQYYATTTSSAWGTVKTVTMTTSDDSLSNQAWGAPNSDDIFSISYDVDCDYDAKMWNGDTWGSLIANLDTEGSSYGVVCPNTATPALTTGGQALSYTFSFSMYSPWARDWRWSTDTSNNTPATFAAATNTTATGISGSGAQLRLRYNVAETNANAQYNARKILQYTTGNPDDVTTGWYDVGDIGSTTPAWIYWNGPGTDDATVASMVLLGSSGVVGPFVEATTSSTFDHATSTVPEYEFPITSQGASGTYYFRMFDLDQDIPVLRDQRSGQTPCYSAAACTYPSVTTASSPALSLAHYRWRTDNGSEASADYPLAEDTSISSNLFVGDRIRLRFLVSNTGSGDATNYTYTLEHSSTSCSAWISVPTAATHNPHWMMDLSSNVADGSATTNPAPDKLTDPGGKSFVAGYLETYNGTTPAHTITGSQFTELEYSIRSTYFASIGTTYCFRLTNAGSTSNFTYTTQPTAVVTNVIVRNSAGGSSLGGEGSGSGSQQGGGVPSGGNNGSEGSGSGQQQGGGGQGGGGGDSGFLFPLRLYALSKDLYFVVDKRFTYGGYIIRLTRYR